MVNIVGICNCFEEYHGGDCAKDNITPPSVMKKAFEKSCDNSVKRCEKIAVPGIDFATTNLTCKIRKHEVGTICFISLNKIKVKYKFLPDKNRVQ